MKAVALTTLNPICHVPSKNFPLKTPRCARICKQWKRRTHFVVEKAPTRTHFHGCIVEKNGHSRHGGWLSGATALQETFLPVLEAVASGTFSSTTSKAPVKSSSSTSPNASSSLCLALSLFHIATLLAPQDISSSAQ